MHSTYIHIYTIPRRIHKTFTFSVRKVIGGGSSFSSADEGLVLGNLATAQGERTPADHTNNHAFIFVIMIFKTCSYAPFVSWFVKANSFHFFLYNASTALWHIRIRRSYQCIFTWSRKHATSPSLESQETKVKPPWQMVMIQKQHKLNSK